MDVALALLAPRARAGGHGDDAVARRAQEQRRRRRRKPAGAGPSDGAAE